MVHGSLRVLVGEGNPSVKIDPCHNHAGMTEKRWMSLCPRRHGQAQRLAGLTKSRSVSMCRVVAGHRSFAEPQDDNAGRAEGEQIDAR